MDPFSAIGTVVVGLIRNGQIQNWCRLLASLLMSGAVTFLFIFGASLLALYEKGGITPVWDIVLSVGAACTSTSGVLMYLWQTDPATKGIPIAFPSKAEMDELAMSLGYDPNKQGSK